MGVFHSTKYWGLKIPGIPSDEWNIIFRLVGLTRLSWKAWHSGINLLGVDIFISFFIFERKLFIHSTYYVTCILLLRNLSDNQSLSNSFLSFFIFTPCVCIYLGFWVIHVVRFFSCVEEEEGCNVVTSDVSKCEEHDWEHTFHHREAVNKPSLNSLLNQLPLSVITNPVHKKSYFLI